MRTAKQGLGRTGTRGAVSQGAGLRQGWDTARATPPGHAQGPRQQVTEGSVTPGASSTSDSTACVLLGDTTTHGGTPPTTSRTLQGAGHTDGTSEPGNRERVSPNRASWVRGSREARGSHGQRGSQVQTWGCRQHPAERPPSPQAEGVRARPWLTSLCAGCTGRGLRGRGQPLLPGALWVSELRAPLVTRALPWRRHREALSAQQQTRQSQRALEGTLGGHGFKAGWRASPRRKVRRLL